MMDKMKGMMNLTLKPSGIKSNVESETMQGKAKIICFAALMGGIATSYQRLFDNVIYRSGQWQRSALAGDVPFVDYQDKLAAKENTSGSQWYNKNDLDVLKSSDFKELFYLENYDPAYSG